MKRRTINEVLKMAMGIAEVIDLSEDEAQDLYLWIMERHNANRNNNKALYQSVWEHAKSIERNRESDSKFTEVPLSMGIYVINIDQIAATNELKKCLDTLDERRRNIIIERFFQGKTLKEVGEIHGISEERARVLQVQGLNKLKENKKTLADIYNLG